MAASQNLVKIVSALLVVAGALLLGMTLFTGNPLNIALPLVILMFGLVFYVLVPVFDQRWGWAAWLYLPGSLLLALGFIFLFNVLTSDWSAWAYAWLLLPAGLGTGLLLTAWHLRLRQEFSLAGIGLLVVSLTLYALFGALVGGLFIQVTAPLMLVAGGLALFWLKPRFLFPVSRGLRPATRQDRLPAEPAPRLALPEPLSTRELEVLRLIDQGLSNAEIAARLTLASSTVKTHINNIYGKLEVQGRVQALNRARELGLLD